MPIRKVRGWVHCEKRMPAPYHGSNFDRINSRRRQLQRQYVWDSAFYFLYVGLPQVLVQSFLGNPCLRVPQTGRALSGPFFPMIAR